MGALGLLERNERDGGSKCVRERDGFRNTERRCLLRHMRSFRPLLVVLFVLSALLSRPSYCQLNFPAM